MSEAANKPNPVRFGFDNSFGEPGGNKGAGSAPRIYSLTDLDDARRDGFEKGHRAGNDEALESVESKLSGQMELIGQQIAQMLQAWDELERQMHREAAILAHALAGKLASGLIAKTPLSEIEALVTQVVEDRTQEPRIVVRISEQDLDAARARVEQLAQAHGFAGDIILLAEDGMTSGDCRVEWAEGGVERCFAHTAATIDTALTRFLEESKQAATPVAEGQLT